MKGPRDERRRDETTGEVGIRITFKSEGQTLNRAKKTGGLQEKDKRTRNADLWGGQEKEKGADAPCGGRIVRQ